jgi:hypothetical protein
MVGLIFNYLCKVKKSINIIKHKLKRMNIDVDDLFLEVALEDQPVKPDSKQITAVGPNINLKTKIVDPEKVAIYRQRIAELISAGNSKEYLGKQITLDQLGIMTDREIEKSYAIYEAKLGLKMTKSLGQSIISLYTASISHIFPVDNKDKLAKDLSDDPIINASLSSMASYLYFQYGAILAPVAAGMITFSHVINSGNKKISDNNIITENGNKSATDSNYSGTDSNYSGTDSNY